MEMNPISRFAAWLGWSEDEYLSALGYLPLLAAFGAGVYLSYSSLMFLAKQLGYSEEEARAFPIAIDAIVAGCYIAQNRLAGVQGMGAHRIYLIVLGSIGALLTGSGNALHGVLKHKVIPDPLPWELLVAGSLVPAIAMAGVGHALMIMRSARKRESRSPRAHLVPVVEKRPERHGPGWGKRALYALPFLGKHVSRDWTMDAPGTHASLDEPSGPQDALPEHAPTALPAPRERRAAGRGATSKRDRARSLLSARSWDASTRAEVIKEVARKTGADVTSVRRVVGEIEKARAS